jgi:hypothetical protein
VPFGGVLDAGMALLEGVSIEPGEYVPPTPGPSAVPSAEPSVEPEALPDAPSPSPSPALPVDPGVTA